MSHNREEGGLGLVLSAPDLVFGPDGRFCRLMYRASPIFIIVATIAQLVPTSGAVDAMKCLNSAVKCRASSGSFVVDFVY